MLISFFILSNLIPDVRIDDENPWLKKVNSVFSDYPICYEVKSPWAVGEYPIKVYIMSNIDTVIIRQNVSFRIFVESLHDEPLDCRIMFFDYSKYVTSNIFEVVSRSENWEGVLNAGQNKYIDIVLKPKKYQDIGMMGEIQVSPDMSKNPHFVSAYSAGIEVNVKNSVPPIYYEAIKYLDSRIQSLEEYIYNIENEQPFVETFIQRPPGFTLYFNEDGTAIIQLPAELEQELESLFKQVKSLKEKYNQLKSEL